MLDHLPRHRLAFLPTPVHPLPRLNAWLHDQGIDADIWIKRDDQTGLALGGNKTRKLEFLAGDALARGCDTLITTGAAQSNHCRQTAAAAAQAGLDCHLVLSGTPAGAPNGAPNGNLLLDHLLGATIHWTTRENRIATLRDLDAELSAAGRRPYFVTYGGSDPVGATGYASALAELAGQMQESATPFDAVVFASSSGGTQAGLVAGAWTLGMDVRIVGISIDEPQDRLAAGVAALASDTARHIGHPHDFTPSDIVVDDGYLGGGYGVMGDLEREAIRVMASVEGILLDPVYTGRAFGGLLSILRRAPETLSGGDRPPRLLFWHTGGAPALFAYAADLHIDGRDGGADIPSAPSAGNGAAS